MLENSAKKRNRLLAQALAAWHGDSCQAELADVLANAALYGQDYPEFYLASALLLEKAGYFDSALIYWNLTVRNKPQKLEWLESAINFAWRHESDCAGVAEMLQQWLKLLEHVFSATPPAKLLAALTQRGWQGKGSIGITGGQLCGWFWLPKTDKLAFNLLHGNVPLKLELKPQAASQSHILYKLALDLPNGSQSFVLSVKDGSGEPINGSPVACFPSKNVICQPAKIAGKPVTTIIIPVYDDYRATLACVGTVLASRKNNPPFRILAVWDHGPNVELRAALQRLAAEGKISLLQTPANMGFLGSINYALGSIPGGDVLLLNSDTLVHGDWLARMATHAQKNDAATITALGNEAELLSYPSNFRRGNVRNLRQTRILDQAAACLNPEYASCEVPVGVGFCMLITRRAINAIGGFDGQAVFRGYSEEVDYCLRAAAAGLKNYAALNVFVGHLGGRSFGAAKRALAAQNNDVIHKTFPKYKRDYENFISAGITRKACEKISAIACAAIAPIPKLQVLPWSSIILQATPQQADADRAKALLFAHPCDNGYRLCLRLITHLPLADLNFYLPADYNDFTQVVRQCGINQADICFEDKGLENILRTMGLELNTRIAEQHAVVSAATSALPKGAYLVATPQGLDAWRKLNILARNNRECQFYVPAIGRIWARAPKAPNIMDPGEISDLRPLDCKALLLHSDRPNSEFWTAWLEEKNLPNLPIHGAV